MFDKEFLKSQSSLDQKLNNFPKYVRRQAISRFLCKYHIFQRQLNVKGSIVECGVNLGGGVFSWAHFSTILEPYNYHRKIIGFDTFQGFPSINKNDGKKLKQKKKYFRRNYDVRNELLDLVKIFDKNRFIGHKKKIELIKGNAIKTIPKYIKKNKELLVSLLFLDFDIYAPTVTALKYFLPRMSKGGIIAFDQVNNPDWPGETLAYLKRKELKKFKLENISFEPNISFLQLK
tara:strand:- start:665 stop:1360 length:696 start_codon:yes stop_codon:yes gene_type:complete